MAILLPIFAGFAITFTRLPELGTCRFAIPSGFPIVAVNKLCLDSIGRSGNWLEASARRAGPRFTSLAGIVRLVAVTRTVPRVPGIPGAVSRSLASL